MRHTTFLLAGVLSLTTLAIAAPAPCKSKPAKTPAKPAQPAALTRAFKDAGKNAPSLTKALTDCPADQKTGMSFLIENMAPRDCKNRTAKELLTNVDLAYKSWRGAPWHKDIPEPMFLQYILPHAHFNEDRDAWRTMFVEKFQKKAWECKTPTEAAKFLNKYAFEILKVKYHATKRPKPDQAVTESIKAGYASCTGLSIILANACRSVGIPARIVGVPSWTKIRGNHNWVEVWDQQWKTGNLGDDPRGRNWVYDRCVKQTNDADWKHRIYAAIFRRTKQTMIATDPKTLLFYPLVWDMRIRYVPAITITKLYTHPTSYTVDLGEKTARVEAWKDGDLFSCASGRGKVTLANLPGDGTTMTLKIITADGKIEERAITVTTPKPKAKQPTPAKVSKQKTPRV